MHWFVSLVLECGASLRCAAKVFELFGSTTGQDGIDPDRSTGRLWLLRIGLAALLRPKVIADDWVWLVDHSIQIGQCKCLVILGIRLCDLPEGRPLLPSGHGADRLGADDEFDQADRGRVPGERRGPDRRSASDPR